MELFDKEFCITGTITHSVQRLQNCLKYVWVANSPIIYRVIDYNLDSRKSLVVLQLSLLFNKLLVMRGSCVHLSAIDASKAFDRVDHNILFRKLAARDSPQFFINIIMNWYSKLNAVVRWSCVVSYSFAVYCGVRQGGVLIIKLMNWYSILNTVVRWGCVVSYSFVAYCGVLKNGVLFIKLWIATAN